MPKQVIRNWVSIKSPCRAVASIGLGRGFYHFSTPVVFPGARGLPRPSYDG